MKKFFAAALAVALTFAMSVTAFAAESIKVDAVKVTLAEGNATVAEFNEEQASGHRQSMFTQQSEIAAALGVANLAEVNIVGLIDVQGTASEANPLTLTFNVQGVKAEDIVNVLHFVGGKWEVLPAVAGDGTVTATFTSLSPIAFAIQPAAAVNPPENPTVTDPTEQPSATDPAATDPTEQDAAPEAPADANTSPKTADNGIALFVIAGLAAAAGIAAVSRRKVEE